MVKNWEVKDKRTGGTRSMLGAGGNFSGSLGKRGQRSRGMRRFQEGLLTEFVNYFKVFG